MSLSDANRRRPTSLAARRCWAWLAEHRTLTAAVISGWVHFVAIVVCGTLWIELPVIDAPRQLAASFAPRELVEPERVVPLKIEPRPELARVESVATQLDIPAAAEVDTPRFALGGGSPRVTTPVELGPAEAATHAGAVGAEGGLAGLRSPGGRRSAGEARGATSASEAAVDRALEWFVRHQRSDGAWSLEYRSKQCKAECDHAGTLATGRVAATSLALLPFLGAGHTHRQGNYRAQVARGLKFLERVVESEGHAAEPNGGGMYAHALATIVLCEAYAMTGDRALMRQAQRAVHFIAASQDPLGGGWRYVPGQPGDTSAVGWQLMALKSGHMSYIRVSPDTVAHASRFLDSVQLDGGAEYGYLPGYLESRGSTTAIGLLSRMLLGWKRDESGLVEGVRRLGMTGPSPNDYYYNYYATQVMHHYEGPAWAQWNAKLRDQLVTAQSKRGHSAGSWYVEGGFDGHQSIGGRLYCTSLAAMTLEVYYRYLPLYQAVKQEAAEAERREQKAAAANDKPAQDKSTK